jgi:hypothetical protein
MSPRLALELERDRYAPGETVSGVVRVVEGGGSRSLEVALEYRERTRDYSAVARRVATGPLHQGELPPGHTFPFSLQLPADAPPAHSTPNASLAWHVDAKSDERGLDTHDEREIHVEPPPG